jgi:predicted aldo/keto reductase-like oxidoreductase
MRLPLKDRDPANVDEPESIRMIRYAIDHGVNYLDTAYGYHSGQSERIVGRALQDGYRQRIRLATKLPVQLVESAKDFDRILNEQLERLQTDKLDFYLLHGLNGRSWAKVRDLGILRWAEDTMAEGRFDHLGFSFHDDYDAFQEIVDAYDNWTLSQIQYNYMDVDYQAGRRGLEYAAGKGLAVVVMEPLRGGRLANVPPEQVARVWESAPQKRSPVEWALLWVWNQPEVAVALSGMSAMEHVVENVAVAARSGAGTLTADDLALFDSVQEAYQGSYPVPCTSCGYCMPCPNGVEIPSIRASSASTTSRWCGMTPVPGGSATGDPAGSRKNSVATSVLNAATAWKLARRRYLSRIGSRKRTPCSGRGRNPARRLRATGWE